jgi:DNA-directed RNA polymerase subunit B
MQPNENNKESITQEDLWDLAKAYIKEVGLVQHHLRSYNAFIEKGLQSLINSLGDLEIKTKYGSITLKFGAVEVGEPRVVEIDGTIHSIFPSEARLRNLTYAAPIYIYMSLYFGGKLISSERIEVGIIPVMLRSNICLLSRLSPEELEKVGEDPLDPGGYFIINGSERVLTAFEDLAPNKVIITEKETSSGKEYIAAILSASHGRQARVEVRYKPGSGIRVFFSNIYKGIPAIIMLRALGFTSDKDIAELISQREDIQALLEPSFDEAEGIETPKDAIKYIGNRVAFGYAEEYRILRAENLLDSVFLLHLGTNKHSRQNKAIFLCEMISQLLETSIGIRKPSDKDHYSNKRLKLASALLEELYRAAFTKLLHEVRYHLERMPIIRQPITVSTFVRPGVISDFVKHAFATGNWPGGRVGVTQLLNRTNYIATLSHLRRVQSPLSRSQPHFEARDLHGTHWGRLCPNETPEGANCGLVKNLALSAEFSSKANIEKLIESLPMLGMIPISEAFSRKKYTMSKIFLDGQLIGFHSNPIQLVHQLRTLRRKGELDHNINIAFHSENNEVWICSDEGRVRRPILIIEKGKLKLTKEHIDSIRKGLIKFSDLISMGMVEFLDAEEEENALIALTLDKINSETTHLEICPYLTLGLVVSIIPFAEHNQSPRNTYEGAMAKQALGVFSTSYSIRTDSRFHIMHYPQKPLVTTKTSELAGLDIRPIGQNFVVAIISYQGYNMEDAIILNRSAVERGLGLTTSYRLYEAEARQYLGGQKDRFCIPEPSVRGYRGEQFYKVLDEDGLAHVESQITGGAVVIGRVSPPRFIEEYQKIVSKPPVWRDSSETVRLTEGGVVDNVFITTSEEGNKIVKARIRTLCFPEIGDKFSSRHGQKGVVGMLFPQEDMPYTESGIVPDLIINPHAFPSRMTLGQLFESIAGKVACILGKVVDGTPFFKHSIQDLQKELQELGFQYSGKEVMYDGITGKKYEADIFIGVVYYQRLHHLVRDKIHARARGQVQMLTRQPTEGRARGGGLKFGEMERDCLIAYGASFLLLDRLLEQSDLYTAYFCENCGYPAYYDLKQEKYVCRICGKNAKVHPVSMSYAFYLLLNEMMSMCISPKVSLSEEF